MLTEFGRIVAVEPEQVWVETIRSSACESCRAKSVCGQKVLAQWQQNQETQAQKNYVPVRTNLIVSEGDEVEIGIPEDSFIKGALLLYLLPLISLLLVSVLLDSFFHQDVISALGGIASFGLALLYVRKVAIKWQQDDDFRPVLLRKLPANQ